MIKCPSCGAELSYSVKKEKVTCDYCGCSFTPSELKDKYKEAKERVTEIEKNGEVIKANSYSCSSCGATLLTFDETAITFCSYCGSTAMIKSKMIEQNKPDFVIPFSISKEQCIDAYKKKLKKSLFAPKYMLDDVVVEKFRGIYMPYCIYSFDKHGEIVERGSKYSRRRGNYDYYDDYTITANVDAEFDGVSYDLVSKFYDKYSQSIAPYDTTKAIAFDEYYMSGFYADCKDVNETIYEDNAEKYASSKIRNEISNTPNFRKYGCTSPITTMNIKDKKIGMFPVYFLSIRDKANKNISYAVVNGQTGKIAVDIPLDYKKYIISALILSILLFGLTLLFKDFYIVPNTLLWFSVIASIISLIISNSQLNKIKVEEQYLNDEGYSYINSKEKVSINSVSEFDQLDEKEKTSYSKIGKMRLKDKITKYLYKQLIALIISLFVIFTAPISDMYYYITATISLLLVLSTFYDLVKENNLLKKRKIPQLDKRGGDENA